MGKVIKLSKGYDIRIRGRAEMIVETPPHPGTFALSPLDFRVLSPMPKLCAEPGTDVKAGDPLFYDKINPDILYTAPVSGEVAEIRRGDKRRITGVIILADKEIRYREFKKASPGGLSREQVIASLLESGAWPMIRQRPYGITANPKDKPDAIFISAFDTSPLAPDNDFLVHGKGDAFQAGIDALRRITEGAVHLNLNARTRHSGVFTNCKGVQINYFSGPHPAGNVGVQIHHIRPIRKGDIIWFVHPQDVLTIGGLFLEGRYNAEKVIAVAGPEVARPRYFKTRAGACLKTMLAGNLKSDNTRVISGNVLTGRKTGTKGYLGFYDNMITVIAEGNEPEFLGWLMPSYRRPSVSRTFLSGWLSMLSLDSPHRVNTAMHGDPRPFVMTGQYEQVLPMDIYPVHLLKSILYKDLDQMEGLGIYEVTEEDLALCEFVCTSKINVQQTLREGLDMIRTETGG